MALIVMTYGGWIVALTTPLHLGCLEVPGPVDLEVVVDSDAGPVDDAVVLLIPARLIDENQWKRPYAFGRTDRQGHTRLKTERGTQGVLPGIYRAWVVETDVDLSRENDPAPLLRYSTQDVKVVSANVTPRVQLRHQNPRVLEDFDFVPERWADRNTLPSLAKTLQEAFETIPAPQDFGPTSPDPASESSAP